jgi:hypothetical protein
VGVDSAGLACIREAIWDQFNIYVCDRFIIPVLTPDQQRAIGRGILLLDQMTKAFIREHLLPRQDVSKRERSLHRRM